MVQEIVELLETIFSVAAGHCCGDASVRYKDESSAFRVAR